MRWHLYRLLLSVLGIVVFNWSAAAIVIRVPEDYPTVLEGVDAAASGDSVLVGPGKWTDREMRLVQVGPNLVNVACAAFLRPGISLIGTGGANETTLDGGPADVAQVTVLHNLVGTETARVEGFTILAGSYAFAVYSSSPLEINGCQIVGVRDQALEMGQNVNTSTPSKTTMRNCVITECLSPGLSASVFPSDSILELYNTRFEDNPGGGISGLRMIRFVAEDCVFINHPDFRAIRMSESTGEMRILRSLFLRSSSATASGGAISGSNIQNGLIEFCTFAFDSALGTGGALSFSSSGISVNHCTFDQCHALNGGSAYNAINLFGAFQWNIVSNCSGSAALRGGIGLELGCNVLWGNAEGNYEDGWVPAPTDILKDPLYCGPSSNDWSVDENSPCVPPGSGECGNIGAWGVGCGTISLDETSWGKIKEIYR